MKSRPDRVVHRCGCSQPPSLIGDEGFDDDAEAEFGNGVSDLVTNGILSLFRSLLDDLLAVDNDSVFLVVEELGLVVSSSFID